MLGIDGDPSKDITAIGEVPLVFKDGVGYDTARVFAAMKETVGLHWAFPSPLAGEGGQRPGEGKVLRRSSEPG